jgi:hypothetical protein
LSVPDIGPDTEMALAIVSSPSAGPSRLFFIFS